MRYPTLLLFVFLFANLQLSAQENDRYRLLFSDEVYFGPGDATLGKNYHSRLKAVAKVIAEEKVEKIIVQAHTDSIGTEASNEKLSYDRASGTPLKLLAAIPGAMQDEFLDEWAL